jgi:preprotein translocase subunit SecA
MLRTAAGGDSLTEYQRAASRLAAKMWQSVNEDFVGYWFKLEVTVAPD